jgi:acetyl-CoA carboxylase biotin carboxyl carrier protein
VKIKKIRKIIKAFERSTINQLEISVGKMKIKMQKPIGSEIFSDSQNPPASSEVLCKSQWIHSPLVGTFYIRLTNDSTPLITLGKPVKKDDILCIIETMKVFNEIKSPVDGVISKIMVDDGQMVEYHQPIIEVRCND